MFKLIREEIDLIIKRKLDNPSEPIGDPILDMIVDLLKQEKE